MSWPMHSLSGPIVCRPLSVYGEWVHVEFWIPLLDDDGDSSVMRCFCNVDHADIAGGNQSAIEYIIGYVRENIGDSLGPIAFQRVQEALRSFLAPVDFKKLLPPLIPAPTTKTLQ